MIKDSKYLYDNFYYASRLLHREIHNGKDIENKTFYDSIKRHKRRVGLLINFPSNSIRFVINIINSISKPFLKQFYFNKKPKIIIDISVRFGYLITRIEETAKENGYQVINITRKKNIIKRIFFLKSSFRNGFSFSIHSKTSEIINDDKNMFEIDNYLKNEVIEISKKLVSANVQHVFNIDSSRLDSLLLTESSKHSNIPVFSFLHGYLSSNMKDFPKKRLLDNLLVWDYRLKKILMPFYDEPDKIINFGYPKYDLKKINQMKIKPKYDFLFALSYTPISEIVFLLEFINEINLKEKKVLIRFHHFNYDLDRNKISQIMKKNNHIDYHFSSRNDLLIDLLSSEKVLGFNTSVLFEAYVLGKNVYQIQSNKISIFMDYEFIPILNIDSLAMEQIRIILFENKKNKFSKLNKDFKEDIINLLKY